MSERRRPFPGADYLTDQEYQQGIAGDMTMADLAVQRKRAEETRASMADAQQRAEVSLTGCAIHPSIRNPHCPNCRAHARPGDHFLGDPD